MDEMMKKKLIDLAIFKEIGSLSGVIAKILLLLIPVLEQEHKWGEQRMSRYMLVNKDPSHLLPGNILHGNPGVAVSAGFEGITVSHQNGLFRAEIKAGKAVKAACFFLPHRFFFNKLYFS
jgi:hypothetical protein